MNTPIITLDTPQAVLAAIPMLLRFVPSDSLVAIMVGADRRTVRCAIRCDITISEDQAAALPDTCHLTAEHNGAAVLVAVCDPGLRDYAFAILDATRLALRAVGIPVARMLTTDSLAERSEERRVGKEC